jgi:hypothetical protein
MHCGVGQVPRWSQYSRRPGDIEVGGRFEVLGRDEVLRSDKNRMKSTKKFSKSKVPRYFRSVRLLK